MQNLKDAAILYLNKGINCIATGSTKRAIMAWKKYQTTLIAIDEIEEQFNNINTKGLAVICGSISGGLEVIDLDLKYDLTGTLYDRLIEECPKLKDLYTIKTKSGGYHFYYYCEQIEGNKKLANRYPTEDELKANPHEKEIVLIETRGEGGYVIAPPTNDYTLVSGKEITFVNIDEREAILAACRSFNEVIHIVEKPKHQTSNVGSFSKEPWTDYNERSNPVELLERHGWQVVSVKGDRTIFKRPGKTDSKSSGDYHHGLKLFKVFTTSSEFEPNKGYSPYAIYTLLEHKGNYSESAKQLIKDGYGESSKTFDKKILNKVNRSLGSGYSKEKVIEQLMVENSIPKNLAETTVNDIIENNGEQILTFWEIIETKHGKEIHINRTMFIDFLFKSGYHLYFYDEGSNIFRFVRQQNGFVSEATSESMKKFIKSYIQDLPPKFDSITPNDLLEVVLRGGDTYFGKGLLEFLDRSRIDLLKDDANTAYFPFKNGVVKVDKNGSKLLSYGDVGKVIWQSQVIDANIDVDMDFDFQLCEFYKFMTKICGEDEDKLAYLISIIGYLLHRYKDPSRPYAVVFAEETEDEKKGGGTGKGIVVKALSYMSNIERVDGKNFKLDKNFAFQRVGLDTKIVAIEDVRKNVDFEGFYSIITEGITVEKKNKDELFIPYKDSPKVLFTTNYTIPSMGNHAKRRQRVFEFSNYFSSNFTPMDLFGHKLFDDWDADEFNRFYNLMFTCVSFYLNSGVLNFSDGEKMKRKHIKLNFGEEFMDWFDEEKDKKFSSFQNFKDLYDGFLKQNDYDKKDYSSKRFKKAIEESCEKFDYELVTERDKQSRLIVMRIEKRV